jgi:uncharacterized membrane protein YfcA
VLCFALILTARLLLFRKAILERYRWRLQQLDPRNTARATVLVGAALGVLVSISSVGAGAVGVTALLLLYPELPMTRIVGSDIAHFRELICHPFCGRMRCDAKPKNLPPAMPHD